MQILKLLIDGMRENFNKITEDQETKETEPGPEDSSECDELVPGKSVILSVLEVVFCLLMQKVPTLNSNISGFLLSQTGSEIENDILIAETVKCLELLLDICSDEGIRFYFTFHICFFLIVFFFFLTTF